MASLRVGFTFPLTPTIAVGLPGESAVIVSPSWKVCSVFVLPPLSYFTNKVAESVEVNAVALTTVAVIPEVLPVIFLPI